MAKEQSEIELKKIEVEKAKVLEGILRTLVISILTLGAGIGGVLYKLYPSKTLEEIILILLSTFFIVFVILAVSVYFQIRKLLKKVEVN
ncbi:MAG: hypothetical protein GXO45_03305 [Aquificae bacterium]|nr:hypothetical protein [Aquificota bacterium]